MWYQKFGIFIQIFSQIKIIIFQKNLKNLPKLSQFFGLKKQQNLSPKKPWLGRIALHWCEGISGQQKQLDWM
jgi:hypothetical protein